MDDDGSKAVKKEGGWYPGRQRACAMAELRCQVRGLVPAGLAATSKSLSEHTTDRTKQEMVKARNHNQTRQRLHSVYSTRDESHNKHGASSSSSRHPLAPLIARRRSNTCLSGRCELQSTMLPTHPTQLLGRQRAHSLLSTTDTSMGESLRSAARYFLEKQHVKVATIAWS